MQIVIAVIEDLYRFAVYAVASVFDFFVNESRATNTEPSGSPAASRAPTSNEAAVGEPKDDDVSASSAFRSVETVLVERPRAAAVGDSHGSTVMYVGGAETPLFREPTIIFDSVLSRLPYGMMVMVLEHKGRWAKIAVNGMTGWIERADLVDRAAHVYPHFIKGETNEHDDLSTVRVRAIISDEFGAGLAGMPLQAGEYVLYRLTRKGIHVPWPETRPRNAGRWHEILKGAPGVSIGVKPRSGSVMEYVSEDEIGHLAYVEAVFPDESINISEANAPDRGIYNERILAKDEWKELRPVFITIT